MDEKLYRELSSRMAQMSFDVFAHPPTSYEEFRERFGAWKELKRITDKMVEDAKGIEKE